MRKEPGSFVPSVLQDCSSEVSRSTNNGVQTLPPVKLALPLEVYPTLLFKLTEMGCLKSATASLN